jgi:signal transduction histidine kinase
MSQPLVSPTGFNGQDYTILIVDDNPTNLGVIADYLERRGFEIMIARSGNDALEKVERLRPDLILLDIVMPGIDGFETCRQLKATDLTRDIPVIFMTALVEAEHKVKGFEVGAVDYVTKPVQQEEVLARVTTHLRLRDLTLDLQQAMEQIEARRQVEQARLFEAVNQQSLQLRTLTRRLTEIQESERKRLAQELHDEMGQALTAISIDLSRVISKLPADFSETSHDRLVEALTLTDQTLERIRELSLDLRPSLLDDLGLIPALRWYVKRFEQRVNVEVDLQATGLQERLSNTVEITLYRVVQEALTNVARYAQANRVTIQLEISPTAIATVIQDDGRGFDLETATRRDQPASGAGLLGIQERVVALGGQFEIDTGLGQGVRLSVEIPREET